jgi:transposase
MGVAIGIDSHKKSLGAGVTDELGREVAAKEFPNDPQGHKAPLAWARGRGAERRIGIEGSGSYGAGVARFLLAAGEDVKEVPKVTRGSYFPSLLEPRRRAERALHAVVVEAYVKSVSTRKVDDLVKALGDRRHLEVRGQPAVQGARPGSRGVSYAANRGRMPLHDP